MILKDTLRYELPPEGTTLLGYVVRRMHKTEWLLPVPGLLETAATAGAMAQVAMYSVASSTSFGRAFYQPQFDRAGEQASGVDPMTGATVNARLESVSPHYLISYAVEMVDGSSFHGSERITGTTIGWRGLGMPAPSDFHFQSGDYSVSLRGTITSELVLSLLGRTRIRAYGALSMTDSAGNAGTARVERNGRATIEVNGMPFFPAVGAKVLEAPGGRKNSRQSSAAADL